jgi:hypothetical protein
LGWWLEATRAPQEENPLSTGRRSKLARGLATTMSLAGLSAKTKT